MQVNRMGGGTYQSKHVVFVGVKSEFESTVACNVTFGQEAIDLHLRPQRGPKLSHKLDQDFSSALSINTTPPCSPLLPKAPPTLISKLTGLIITRFLANSHS